MNFEVNGEVFLVRRFKKTHPILGGVSHESSKMKGGKGEGRDRAASDKQRLANEHKLREAAYFDQVEKVRALLDLKTNPNAQDEVNLSSQYSLPGLPIFW